MEKNKKGVFTEAQVDSAAARLNITALEQATIGEALLLARKLEGETGIEFIRMDQGVPGLEPELIGRQAEKDALDTGLAAVYPAAEGIPQLKNAASEFLKAFLNVEIAPEGCIPVTGSVAGSFASFILCSQMDESKKTILFIDPGFPIQKSQLKIIGAPYRAFDIHDFRGAALKERLEAELKQGDIAGIIYSNPNNPAWICLDETELQIIGQLATKYGVIVLEDLAYFGMDFRRDLGKPYQAPYPPTVARYTENYILMLSSSKIFSYAGQRAAFLAVPEKLFKSRSAALAQRYGSAGVVGETLIASILYMITSGVTHTTQFGFAAMLKAAVEGRLNFVEKTSEYARRARKMKDLFRRYGFHVVYEKDPGGEISDGFFFTLGYKDWTGARLMKELFLYGISSITLATTGSEKEGIRACVSRMSLDKQFDLLEERLKLFSLNNG